MWQFIERYWFDAYMIVNFFLCGYTFTNAYKRHGWTIVVAMAGAGIIFYALAVIWLAFTVKKRWLLVFCYKHNKFSVIESKLSLNPITDYIVSKHHYKKDAEKQKAMLESILNK